jgi:hypothetical protein
VTPHLVGTQMPFTRWEESISSLQRTRSAPLRSPLSFRPLGGPKHYLISRSPGQHVSQAGRGEQRAEVSCEDPLPTR